MSTDRFNEYTPQQQVQAAIALLRAHGAPATAENMNRAIMALMHGSDMTGELSPVMERALQRSMAPRRPMRAPAAAAAPMPVVPRDDSGGNDGPDGTPPRPIQEAAPMTRGEQVARVATLPPEQRNAAMPGGRRAGTINGATRFEETDEDAADMFRGTPPRQADEEGIDPIGLAIALGLPLLLGASGAASGRAAQEGAEFVGRMPIPPTGRVIDVPLPALTGPAPRRALPRPDIPPPAIGGPSGGPTGGPTGGGGGGSGSGGGGGSIPRISSETTNQPLLPRMDGEMRRRMIERNIERAYRNEMRTRDERAAGNTTRGRRERIIPVPPGEVAPAPPQQPILLGRPRYRVKAGRSTTPPEPQPPTPPRRPRARVRARSE